MCDGGEAVAKSPIQLISELKPFKIQCRSAFQKEAPSVIENVMCIFICCYSWRLDVSEHRCDVQLLSWRLALSFTRASQPEG